MGSDADEFRLLERLFFELEELGQDERARRFESLRDERPELAAELAQMIETAPGDRPGLLELFRTEAEERKRVPAADRRVAGYRVLRRLGEGGMGVVYEAEQLEPIRRKVALKLIKWGADSREVVARFESERQVLALMDHANVARVFEAGATADGRPYFAMELVDGKPITTYCDRHRLPMRARLALMIDTCRAVQHAHRKGIIHRDLKPSNILVAELEGRPVVKIIDFGIAKAISRLEGPATLYTEHGRLIGTPEYMSPEQLEGGGIDTRSDVYSLGVLLFELLAGCLPVPSDELRSWSLEQLGRKLRELETPKPSERLDPTTEASRDVAQQRQTDVGALVRELRGDLDWIALKALAKEREQRYESAADLASELERYLADEPVLAGPPSLGYRARKFVRRHRVTASVGAALLLAMVLGVVGLLVGLQRAQRAEAAALREAATTRDVLDFMRTMLTQGAAAAGQGQNLSATELFERARRQLRDDPPSDPLVYGTVLNRLGEFYYMDLEQYPEATRLLDEAERILREADTDGRELSTSLYLLGALDRLKGDLERGMRRQEEALALRSAIDGEDSGPVADVLSEIAQLHRAAGDEERALAVMRQSLAMAQRFAEADSQGLLAKKLSLAGLLMFYGHPEEADELHREVLRRATELRFHELESVALNNLGSAAYRRGDLAAAIQYIERAYEITRDQLGGDPYRLELLLSNLGMLSAKQGQYDRAADLLHQSLDRVEESTGLETPAGSAVRLLLAEVYLRAGRYVEARRQLQIGLDVAYRVPPQAPPVSPLRAERNFALLEEAEGNLAGARRRLERAAAQPEWAEKDPEGVCLLLYERSRMEPDSARARQLFESAEQRCEERASTPGVLYSRARHLANHGEIERALDLLDEMAGQSVIDVWPALDPALAVLRSSVRFEEFLEHVTPR